ncbi:hypothetical protein [uncultured Dialister sp.]|uniref:hypothetical protein n=1 Tax=uncultured Dialister sp. TaxID=278064 RepID=UPI0026DBB957|nr:hypothetical protein [uncultured Dialister sp.]
MAINTLEYAKIFQTELDKKIEEQLTSAWMDSNAGQVKYTGGDEVKIPKISLVGLGNYDRDAGFKQGSVTLSYETMKLTQDRGRTFQLDSQDVDETNFVASAGMVMGEFQRTQVVPEVDAYRYAKIYEKAKTDHSSTYTATAKDIIDKLEADIATVQDKMGDNEPLVICMNRKVHALLNNAEGIQKYINVGDFNNGFVSTKVKIFNDVPIIDVPSARFKTAYTFNAGDTADKGGFEAASGAQEMNWIIIARRAAIAVVKTDKIRIFAPDVNQKADAWKIDYRKYHDLWVKDNAMDGIIVNVPAAT